LTPEETEEIRAGVDANFTDQKHPVFKVGSKKWLGVQKWSFYIGMFFSLSQGDQASLAMSPLEYLESWEEEPRLMAILQVIQQQVRHCMARQLEKVKEDSHAGTRRIPNSPTVKR
jgi:hypothetical protein